MHWVVTFQISSFQFHNDVALVLERDEVIQCDFFFSSLFIVILLIYIKDAFPRQLQDRGLVQRLELFKQE